MTPTITVIQNLTDFGTIIWSLLIGLPGQSH